jgi:hypothetical protein
MPCEASSGAIRARAICLPISEVQAGAAQPVGEVPAAGAAGGAGVEQAEHQAGELLVPPDRRKPGLRVAAQAPAVTALAVPLAQAAASSTASWTAMFMPLPPAGVIK